MKVDEQGERIPLTIADYDREKGTVTIIFQMVGKTTMQLGELNEGDYIMDFVGPLGIASHFDGMKKVAVIGGGVGCAIAYPQAKALFNAGAEVDVIAGFRSKDLVILEDEMRKVSTNFYLCTDDGSYVEKALVTDVLKRLIESGKEYDTVIAIGPLVMMKYVSPPDQGIRHTHDCKHEPDYDRRHGHVRLLPRYRRRRDEVRLRRRPGL